MKKTIWLILMSIPGPALSQDFNTVYYNSNWEITSVKFAKYYRNSGFDPITLTFDSIVTDHYADGSVEMTGTYSKGNKEGPFIYYFPDHSVKLVSNYSANKRSGTWTSYFENGQVNKVVEYNDGAEMLKAYYDRNGKSLMKNLSGNFEYDLYYDYHFNTFTGTQIDSNSEKFSISGDLDNGIRDGKWIIKRYIPTSTRIGDGNWQTSVVPTKLYQMNYEKGKFTGGFRYANNVKEKEIISDSITWLIHEPEKISITEALFSEPGQMIRQNYVIKAVKDSELKSIKKTELKNELELADFFERNYSSYVKDCADTIRLEITLDFDDQGHVSVKSIKPVLKGFEKEVRRVISLVSAVRVHSSPAYILNYRLHCLEELDYKK